MTIKWYLSKQIYLYYLFSKFKYVLLLKSSIQKFLKSIYVFSAQQEKLLEKKNELYFTLADLNADLKKYNEDRGNISEKLQELNSLINEKEKNLQKIQFQVKYNLYINWISKCHSISIIII